MSTYLLINILSPLIPLVLSFDKKVHYYKRFNALFPAIFISAFIFIGWDIFFTAEGVWGFNREHLGGKYFFNLPLEEVLFFITIPYSSVFIYDVMKMYFPNLNSFNTQAKKVLLFLAGFMLVLALLNHDKWYTLVNAVVTVVLIIVALLSHFRFKAHLLIAFVIVLLPFSIVNGILTGSGLDTPVVWYNNAENLGIRLATIPVEDIFYGFNLILLNVLFYEAFQHALKHAND